MLAAIISPNASLAFWATISGLDYFLCRLGILTLQLFCQDLLILSTSISLVVEAFAPNAGTAAALIALHDRVLVAEFVNLAGVAVRVSAPVEVWLRLEAVFAHIL
jgi:hypothetical protein